MTFRIRHRRPPRSRFGALAALLACSLLVAAAPASAVIAPQRLAAARPTPVIVKAARAHDYVAPHDLHAAYDLPTDAPRHVKIAMVVPYDHPDIASDLADYSTQFGLPKCTTANGCLQIVNQSGEASPLPQADPTGGTWTIEAALGTQVAHGVCENCSITLVEADSDSEDDLSTAVSTAASLGAQAVITTFTFPEQSNSGQLSVEYSGNGATVFSATGDNGSQGGATFPASLPNVVAVGGTQLKFNAKGGYESESVWNETTGATTSGCSLYTPAPTWQLPYANEVGCQGDRSIPDIAAVAEPGALVHIGGISSPGGPWYAVDGTSLSTPVVAGEFALAGAQQGTVPEGQLLYQNAHADPGSVHDVLTGSNTTGCGGRPLCQAIRGFDGPTGIGTPNGLNVFGGLDPDRPHVSVRARRLVLQANSAGDVKLTLANANVFPLTASVKLRLLRSSSTSAEGLPIAFLGNQSLPQQGAAHLTLPLWRKRQSLVPRHQKVRVLVVVTLRDDGGRTVQTEQRLGLLRG
jgi:hypothetical protein